MIDSCVENLKGIGKKKLLLLHKLNIYTIKDLLNHYPIRYVNKSKINTVKDVNYGDEVTIKAKIINISHQKSYKQKDILTLIVKDSNESEFEVVFFNAKYVIDRLLKNEIYYFFGKFENNKMVYPEFINCNSKKVKKFLRIMPIYPLVNGLKQWQIVKIVENCLDEINLSEYETLNEDILERNQLSSYNYAIENIHFPKNKEAYKIAKYRLIFEEFFNIQLGMILLKNNFEKENGIKFSKDEKIYEFIEKLPYELTNAQIKVLDEIIIDMQNEKIMNRIIQGDVGSGKTIVALIALYLAVLNGYQGSFMVPTEILAIQHFETIKNYFSNIDIKVRCLTSSVKNKEEIYEEISSGEVDIVIGTHALLQDQVKFNKLGLVITDEQHRFGVRQREKLAENKTTKPDILVMSATPIPRTLSMVIHGDLDISVIDEMPKGRKEISTHFIKKSKKQDMYDFIRKNILDGRQVYFVCPLVEDSDKLDLLSVEKHFQELDNTIFKDLTVKMIHGKLKNNEKDDIMMQFKNKEIDILIATTVIEVGIDVPNANIMVIENAERFGLSQLHQLRGRVGRGEFQSYCFLLSDKFGKIAKERIRIMVETNDGFKISQKDLEIRGPGEILGIKQSGIAEFKIANIIKNNDILIKTQDEIRNILMVYKSGESLEMIEFVNNKSKEILCGYKLN